LGAFNWGAANWSNPPYARVFAYDSYGRPLTLTLTLDGAAGVYTLSYDANGRLQTVAYPSGFTAKYTYTSLGYLYQISDNGSGAVFWTGSARDAELHLLTQLQGSGVTTTQAFDPNTGLVQSILAGVSNGVSNQTFTFDSLGRLTSRTWLNNAGASVKENSCFDGLNRLTSTLVTSGTGCTGTGAVTVTYDALGNITSKSDICATAGCFAYGAGAGPHALTSITGTYNGVTNPTFAYDANGVMTSGAGRTVTATSFNMAASILDGSNTAALAYDADHARYRMVTAGPNAGTTYYLNDPSSGAMEEKSVVGGVTTWHDYIQVEGRMAAERFCTGAAPCASGGATLNYFVLDHLGSITVITDGAGNVLQRLSYDAWGKRRNADGTALNCTSGLASPGGVNRGFTGQEMIDGVCLINFNARIYDPSIGRFMSADPVVGDETVPQELNRYDGNRVMRVVNGNSTVGVGQSLKVGRG
jgi:RHS repeat-associated protein